MNSFIFIILFLLVLLCAVRGQTDTDTALCGFIAGTNIGSLSQYSQWACTAVGETVGDPCSPVWTGLSCSGGLVEQLAMISVAGFSGSLPSSLSQLTALISVDLTEVELFGSIPSNLDQLTSLTRLSLSETSLTGSIPSSLEYLTKLLTLELGYNSLTGTIPNQLGALSAVSYISLCNNSLTGTFVRLFCGVQYICIPYVYVVPVAHPLFVSFRFTLSVSLYFLSPRVHSH